MRNDTEQEYWASVKAHADSAMVRALDGDELTDAIHEECDGSYWVIYYHAAGKCLEYSRNQDAGFDSMGDDCLSGCDSYGMVVTRLAYFALEQDVSEAVSELAETAENEHSPQLVCLLAMAGHEVEGWVNT